MGVLLDGVKVLELGAGSTASSIAGMLLADGGARVIKVEPPAGDRFRTSHPSGFVVWNRGKESLVLDLERADDRRSFRELATGADMVLDGFSAGRADEWEIGYETLRVLNPGLVYAAISGFGTRGAYSTIPGYEPIVAAKAGLFSRGMYGFRDGPLYYPVPWGGFASAMQIVAGALAALRVRTTTGRGQRVDGSLVAGLDPYDFYGTPTWQLAVRRGEGAPQDIMGVTGASRYAIMPCARDGRFIQTPTMLAHQARALVEVTELAGAFDDPKFSEMPQFPTAEIAQEWEDAILEAFRAKDSSHWLARLGEHPDAAFEPLVTSEEALDDPQFQHNHDVVTVRDPVRGAIREVGPIGHFRATPCVIERSAPALDEHAAPWAAEPPTDPTGRRAPDSPLSGVTIVEFGAFYAMPYALAMLANLGARIIKIEDRAGDPARQAFGPEVMSFKTTPGKESVSLDMRDARCQQLVRNILAVSDAFVVGYRPGVVDRMGLDYDTLRTLNKRLVFVQATGYGATGPKSARPLYGPAASAIAGAYGRQAGYWSRPENNEGMSVMEIRAVVAPRLSIIQDGDANGALGLSAAISMALHHQLTTGEGQYVLTSMIASNAWAYADDFCSYDGKPAVPLADEDYLGLDALHRVYEAADGSWVCLHVDTPGEWTRFTAATGLEANEYPSPSQRALDGPLAAALQRLFSSAPASAWEHVLVAARVPCVEAYAGGQSAFTSTDPTMRASGRTAEVPHPLYTTLVRAAPALEFSEHRVRLAPNCLRGQHNDSVLAEFGVDETTRKEWTEAGILFPPDPVVPIPS